MYVFITNTEKSHKFCRLWVTKKVSKSKIVAYLQNQPILFEETKVEILHFSFCSSTSKFDRFTSCGRKVMGLIFYLPKFLFFSNINVIPFKMVSFGSYTPMEMLFPLLVAVLKDFNWYGLQHIRYKSNKKNVLIFSTESPMNKMRWWIMVFF